MHMIEQTGKMNTFVSSLYLSKETSDEILEYNKKVRGIVDPDNYSSHLLDTYLDLLLIARTLHYSLDDVERLDLVDMLKEGVDNGWSSIDPLCIIDTHLDVFFVRYAPKKLNAHSWSELTQAFAEKGYLRPFEPSAGLLLLPELDYCFKTILENWNYTSSDYSLDIKAISCFCPKNNYQYESVNRVYFTIDDVARMARYFKLIGLGILGNKIISCGYNRSLVAIADGSFVDFILSDKALCRQISTVEVMKAIDNIYLGKSVVISV